MMGSAKERNTIRDIGGEDEIIPWKYVPHSVRQKLIKKLNPNALVSGNDWRMLANFLGYNTAHINYIESDKDNNTKVLFRHYDTKPNASFNAVYDALTKMERKDCLDILDNARPEIKQLSMQAPEPQVFYTAETPGMFASSGHYPWTTPVCSCAYSPHPTSVSGSHTYCHCSHGFANCMCSGRSHYAGPSSYHGYPLQPHPGQNLGHTDAGLNTCPSSPCHTPTKEQISCLSRVHQPIPSGYGYHGDTSASRLQMQGNHNQNHEAQAAGLSPGHSGYQVPQSYMYTEGAKSNSNQVGTDFISNSFNNRQYGGDCNIKPDFSTDKRLGADGIRGIFEGHPSAAFPGGSNQDANQVAMPGNNNSPRFAHPSRVSNNVHCRTYQQESIVKVENVQDCINDKTIKSPPISGGATWYRPGPSSTFPMRVKPNQERALEDLNNLAISGKSTSMPWNMKPPAYKKAFRHIKVFVTYSYDNDDHARLVLSLCQFLQNNCFACCVDVFEKENSGKPAELLEWCAKKVAAADFVLACISNKYLEDIASDRQTSATNSNKRILHTRKIYEQMVASQVSSEHNSGESRGGAAARSPCLISLLFPNMTQAHVPHFMVGGPVYNWPGQYKDLAWTLTKPQERIMAKTVTPDVRGSDIDPAVGMSRSDLPMDGIQCNT